MERKPAASPAFGGGPRLLADDVQPIDDKEFRATNGFPLLGQPDLFNRFRHDTVLIGVHQCPGRDFGDCR